MSEVRYKILNIKKDKNKKNIFLLTLSNVKKEIHIYENTYLEFNLSINKTLSKSEYLNMIDFNNYQDALNYALNSINKKPMTSFMLKEKLEKKKYDKHIIDKTLLYLKEKDLTNDLTYSINYIESKLNHYYGIKYIKERLSKKGINHNLFQQAYQEVVFLNRDEEYKKCKEFIKRLLPKINNDLKKAKNKAIYRGYELDSIEDVIDDIENEED